MWRGILLGAALFAAALGGLYFSALRMPALAAAGKDFTALKQTLKEQYRQMQERERRIALSPEAVPESLKSAQENAWREYGAQRDRLAAWVQSQARPTLDGFGIWVSDLWIWLLALGVILPAGGALAGRILAGAENSPLRPDPGGGSRRRSEEAMAQMENTVRRISAIAAAAPASSQETVEAPAPYAPPTTEFVVPEPRADAAPDAPVKSLNLFQEEEAGENPNPYDFQGAETLFQPRVEPSSEPAPEIWSPNGLTMEDETSSPRNSEGDEEDPPWGKMPETTEFEMLERQREEVLRCARKGMTSSEIARRLRISQEQVDLIIRMRRERG
jgi:hypothetical protein